MKLSESTVKWCLENKELVARWLERRGGWQEGDWYHRPGGPYLTGGYSDIEYLEWLSGEEEETQPVWLPTTDDVLEMLVKQVDKLRQLARADWLRIEYDSANQTKPWKCTITELAEQGERTMFGAPRNASGLIALMELLKSCDSTAS